MTGIGPSIGRIGLITPDQKMLHMDLERLAIVCEHEKSYKHQAPYNNRYGAGFGQWCDEGKYVTFFDLAKEFAVEMVAALVAEGVLDADGKNPTITWDG